MCIFLKLKVFIYYNFSQLSLQYNKVSSPWSKFIVAEKPFISFCSLRWQVQTGNSQHIIWRWNTWWWRVQSDRWSTIKVNHFLFAKWYGIFRWGSSLLSGVICQLSVTFSCFLCFSKFQSWPVWLCDVRESLQNRGWWDVNRSSHPSVSNFC